MTALVLYVEGVGAWMPGVPDWPALAGWLRGEGEPDTSLPTRPAPTLLPAGERRRAPLSVLMAVEAAAQAVAMSGRDAASLPAVFASAYGDIGIMDRMCATLATAPAELSPTQFHNSVHNAAAGYWTIASGCREASSAVAAWRYSFAAGLLEAALQACATATPVLLVASDAAGSGPLGEVIACRQSFAAALLLSPRPTATALARISIQLGAAVQDDVPAHSAAVELACANLSARGLVLLEALALGGHREVALNATPVTGLCVHVEALS